MSQKCPEARREYLRGWKAANPHKIAEYESRRRGRRAEQQAAYQSEYYQKNKDRIAARHKRWRESNPERAAAIRSAWRAENPDKEAAQLRRRKYGTCGTELFESQGGKCAICAKPLVLFGGTRQETACIDHHHESGKVRGILCTNCNTAIGMFDEDQQRMAAAIEYLKALA